MWPAHSNSLVSLIMNHLIGIPLKPNETFRIEGLFLIDLSGFFKKSKPLVLTGIKGMRHILYCAIHCPSRRKNRRDKSQGNPRTTSICERASLFYKLDRNTPAQSLYKLIFFLRYLHLQPYFQRESYRLKIKFLFSIVYSFLFASVVVLTYALLGYLSSKKKRVIYLTSLRFGENPFILNVIGSRE